jgi:hypothetical protein
LLISFVRGPRRAIPNAFVKFEEDWHVAEKHSGQQVSLGAKKERECEDYAKEPENKRSVLSGVVLTNIGSGFWGKLQRNHQWTRWRDVNRERLTVEVHCGSGG